MLALLLGGDVVAWGAADSACFPLKLCWGFSCSALEGAEGAHYYYCCCCYWMEGGGAAAPATYAGYCGYGGLDSRAGYDWEVAYCCYC